jgi:hypothetical protein
MSDLIKKTKKKTRFFEQLGGRGTPVQNSGLYTQRAKFFTNTKMNKFLRNVI